MWSKVRASSFIDFSRVAERSGLWSAETAISWSISIGSGDKSYCSCSDFYFRVLSERIPECYHLLAVKIALKEEMYSVIDFNDEEFAPFLRALVKDNFRNVSSQKHSEPELQP